MSPFCSLYGVYFFGMSPFGGVVFMVLGWVMASVVFGVCVWSGRQ